MRQGFSWLLRLALGMTIGGIAGGLLIQGFGFSGIAALAVGLGLVFGIGLLALINPGDPTRDSKRRDDLPGDTPGWKKIRDAIRLDSRIMRWLRDKKLWKPSMPWYMRVFGGMLAGGMISELALATNLQIPGLATVTPFLMLGFVSLALFMPLIAAGVAALKRGVDRIRQKSDGGGEYGAVGAGIGIKII